ncbi:MAG: lipoyl synthase [Treponema sp.]|jgi:lipoic acid synthetase|nr:lipoyl synthase [Treponema sp.]
MANIEKKPSWLTVRVPNSGQAVAEQIGTILVRRRLHTVCDEARCPNRTECWSTGAVTFMLMGDICTRSCRFCAVRSAREGQPLDMAESEAIAGAAEELGLSYVVLTSVDRDDLVDRGAGHFASCIGALKRRIPGVRVEALIPDYTEQELAPILAAAPDVIACNVETVRSLQWIRDSRASFDKTLDTLRAVKSLAPGKSPAVKTSFMLGLGETEAELLAAMDELRAVGVDILVMGQYLRPSPRQIPVSAYIPPEQFERLAQAARTRGFTSVIAAPLARASYHAQEGYARVEAVGKPAGAKLIRVKADVEGGVIRSIQIRGDFFASPEDAFERVERRLAGVFLTDIAAAFDALLLQEGVDACGISGAALAEILNNL